MQKYLYYTYYDQAKECQAVKAVTTYDGRTVAGYAYTHPTDTYDEEFGKTLARMRCQQKILKRKLSTSKKRLSNDTQFLTYLLTSVEDVKKEIEKSECIKMETEAAIKAISVAINDIAQKNN